MIAAQNMWISIWASLEIEKSKGCFVIDALTFLVLTALVVAIGYDMWRIGKV